MSVAPAGPATRRRTIASATGLGVRFGGRAALEDVDLRVEAGSLVGVIGPNGAGKTTLLRALLGLVAHTGEVRVEGRTGYVPQLGEVHPTFPVDALGVVLMGRAPRRGWLRPTGRADRAMARDLLDQVGLADRDRAPFGSLSGGQRQRVLVARALAQEADVLLADEPLTGVDARSAETILAVLAAQRDAGRSVVMTTHDLNQAARVCDQLLVVNRTVIAEGTPAEVFTADVLRRAYGGDLILFDGRLGVLDEGSHHGHGQDG